MLEFICYSDIHHDHYNNGITLEDTIAVEDEITEYARVNQIPLIIFAGDLYRATNPQQPVIKAAEAALKRRSDLGVCEIAIPGNHDWHHKSSSGFHAFAATDIFSQDLKNIHVHANVCIENHFGVNFLFIPAGHDPQNLPSISNGCPLVIVFHDLIAGSYLASGKAADHGICPNHINKMGAICVLGGDNHTPQDLSKIGIPGGMYLGAPLQHNWGDRDQIRGFWHVMIDNHASSIRLIPTKSPRFIRLTLAAPSTDVEALMSIQSEIDERTNGRPAIAEITLVGDKAKQLNVDIIEKNLVGIRRIRIIIDKIFDKVGLIPKSVESPEDKWNYYLTNSTNLETLDVSMLAQIGKWAIGEARKTL